ncbi:hypothetical protein WA026_023233 [Henosepilachna vigintioctopunctata]|uniref:Uncharacterized protein n=1 Tax=Henosepilachna vigintioctopunctata TaxID=420089 RepID=A0AAW1VDU0_9CUCU
MREINEIHLRRVINDSLFIFEALNTFMMQVKACSNFSLFLLYLMIPSTSSNFLMGEPNVPRNTKLYITAALIDINISVRCYKTSGDDEDRCSSYRENGYGLMDET